MSRALNEWEETKLVGNGSAGSEARRDSRLVGKRSGAADWRNFVAVRWRKLSFSRPWREKREILGLEMEMEIGST